MEPVDAAVPLLVEDNVFLRGEPPTAPASLETGERPVCLVDSTTDLPLGFCALDDDKAPVFVLSVLFRVVGAPAGTAVPLGSTEFHVFSFAVFP